MSNPKDRNYKLPILVIVALFLVTIAVSIVVILNRTDEPSPKNKTVTPAPTSVTADPAAIVRTFDAIVAGVDSDNSVITLCPLGDTEFESFIYTGATDIRTSYDKIVTATLLSPGDFMTAQVTADNRLAALTGIKNVNAYRNASEYTYETDPHRITVGGSVYRYDDCLMVLNDGYFVSPSTLYKTDVLSFYSIDDFVYLIKVVSGHGYLNLTGQEAFVGGSLRVGNSKTYPIEPDMHLTLPEGIYNIIAANKDLVGDATVNILRDKTAVFDLTPFSPEPVEYGSVNFSVSPVNAALYIDGIQKDAFTDLALSYGEHTVDVILDGYTPYEGTVNVSRSKATLSIALSEIAQSPVPDEIVNYEGDYDFDEPDDSEDDFIFDIPDSTSDSGVSPAPPDGLSDGDLESGDLPAGQSNDNISGDNTSGEEYIIIHCTDGAAVYINDVYTGLIADGALYTKKICGTVSLRLTREGYLTKSYTVTVDDDGENAEFTFPEMVKE